MAIAQQHYFITGVSSGIGKALAQQLCAAGHKVSGVARRKAQLDELAATYDSLKGYGCDVTDEASMDAVFSTMEQKWGKLDFILHAIAYSDKEELKGGYVDTSRQNFQRTMDISVYSFTAVAKRAAAMMNDGGSMLTLTYYGAERVMPHYNVMGVAKAALEASIRYLAVDLGGRNIRVNGLSAGPMKTLAASGIGDFRYILKWNQYNSPLKRNVTLDDVGGAGMYLLSDLASGVTGETHHVDCGYHVVGMKAVDAPDISVVKDD